MEVQTVQIKNKITKKNILAGVAMASICTISTLSAVLFTSSAHTFVEVQPNEICTNTKLNANDIQLQLTLSPFPIMLLTPEPVVLIDKPVVLEDEAAVSTKENLEPETKKEQKPFWNTLSRSYLTAEQMDLLMKAYKVGFKHNGHKHAEVVQSVLLQETIAGKLGRIGHMSAPVGLRSYGIMQVKVTAAKDMLRKHKSLGHFGSDEEIIAKLISDDEFNLRIASLFLQHLDQYTKTTEQMLVDYNIGLTGSRRVARANNFKYVVKAYNRLENVVRPFNAQYIDQSIKVALN